MKARSISLFLALLIISLLGPAPPSYAAGSLELYGTFHAMGVIVTLGPNDDPDYDASARVEYRVSGSGPYREGFPLSRVAETRFVGSLFFLTPGTCYDVSVTLSDPDGGPMDGAIIDARAFTRAEISIPDPLHSYHVSPSGSGTACTLAAPCPLSEGLSRAGPGDEVILHSGIYYQGEIELLRSGTSDAPIVIRGHCAVQAGNSDGGVAVLDGADPGSTTFTWSHQGGGVYRTVVNTSGTHLVTANGYRLFPYDDLTDLRNLSRGNTPGFYADGLQLYVHMVGDANPNDATMVVSRYNHAFYIEQDYVYLLALTFRHYGQGDWPKTIYLSNASDNLVQGCVFAVNDIGIGLKRDSHRNVIQDNTFYDTLFDWPWDDVKDSGGLEDGGVVFYDPATGRGNVIRRNVFHDDFDGFGVCPSWTAAETNETDVYENLVYNMGDDGVETDGQCSNVRLWDNTFHDVLIGISLAPAYTGPVYAIRNLFYRTGAGNNDYSGSPFKFNSGYGHSGPMYLFHNTADAALSDNNGIYIKAPGTWEMIYARNNIWSGTDYALNNYNETQPIDFDYDDLYTTNPDRFVCWGSDSDRHMHDLSTFQSLTGQEPHGISVEPGFTDAAGSSDYTLDPGSDLIDAGVAIPGINDDYCGTAPDIGAFEHTGDGFTLSADPPGQTIGPGGVATYVIGVRSTGGSTYSVALSTINSSPELDVSLAPTSVTPPGQAILTLRDTQPSAGPGQTGAIALLPGLWHAVPVTGTGGGFTEVVWVDLLVGGARVYLPLIVKG